MTNSIVPTLRAMASSYGSAHCWDHLDGKAVGKAADELERLSSELLKQGDDYCKRMDQLIAANERLSEAHALLQVISEQPALNPIHRARIKTLLSASAEPSAPKCGPGNPCAYPVSCGCQSAPVEIDERAEFEAWWSATMNTQEMDLHRHIYPMNRGWAYACHETNRSWMTWQARAALARKP